MGSTVPLVMVCCFFQPNIVIGQINSQMMMVLVVEGTLIRDLAQGDKAIVHGLPWIEPQQM